MMQFFPDGRLPVGLFLEQRVGGVHGVSLCIYVVFKNANQCLLGQRCVRSTEHACKQSNAERLDAIRSKGAAGERDDENSVCFHQPNKAELKI